MADNLLIIHGGGPTAVLNASLYGAVKEAKRNAFLSHIYGAKNGTGGLIRRELIELEKVPEEALSLLLTTPGSAIGTSRDPLEEAQYEAMARILKEKEIRYVLMNGGNGTMDTCGRLYEACRAAGHQVYVVGIPKTMDNDIAITDHAPGYGSAALYMARSVREVAADVRSLPIHAVVIEASGRNAGWITAASALADRGDGLGPDLIYLPERAFEEERFLSDVSDCLSRKKGLVIVVSEGLHDAEGRPIVPPIFQTKRATYFGDVSSHLAGLIVRRLGYKARGEKPGLLGRASISLQSPVDVLEARICGKEACRAALQGENGKMVALRRLSTEPYQVEPFLTDIHEVMMHERKMPDEFINEAGNGVTRAFLDWARPLLGEEMPPMISFN